MSACTDILAEIYSPQSLSLKRITVNIYGICFALLRVILGVVRIPLQEQLILSVTVNVSDRHIIRRVDRGRRRKRNIKVTVRACQAAVLGRCHLSADDCVHTVFGACRAALVEVAGSLTRIACVNESTVAIELENRVIGIIREKSPVHEHTRAGIDRGYSPIEIFEHVCACI